MQFKEWDVVRLKENGCASGMISGTLGKVRYCHFSKKSLKNLHFHANHEDFGSVPPSVVAQHVLREVCNNSERWELIPQLNVKQGRKLEVHPMKDNFWEELEQKLDESFPKGKAKDRGAALLMFAYAIILHKKYKNEN